jgi:hypothetical protein
MCGFHGSSVWLVVLVIQRDKALRLAGAFSPLTGAAIGYAIGSLLFENFICVWDCCFIFQF